MSDDPMQFVHKVHGNTLTADAFNHLYDDGEAVPRFVLPDPATWKGKSLRAHRRQEPAPFVVVTAAAAAMIDKQPSFQLRAFAEFFSTGSEICVLGAR